MIDHAALDQLRGTLALDGYGLTVAESEEELRVEVVAGPQACDDCLVPKDLMRDVLRGPLGAEDFTLIYPTDS